MRAFLFIFGVFCHASLATPFNRLTIVHSSASGENVLKAKVKLEPASNTGKEPVYGVLTLFETSRGVYIKGKILGLEPGKHGFHVHQNGDIGNDCDNAGGHFNPADNNHGKPGDSDKRHVGDLGNIHTPEGEDHLYTEVNIFDNVISMVEGDLNSIVGRAIVVHAGEDDLGQGGDAESLKTGNAGDRLACGIVELVN